MLLGVVSVCLWKGTRIFSLLRHSPQCQVNYVVVIDLVLTLLFLTFYAGQLLLEREFIAFLNQAIVFWSFM